MWLCEKVRLTADMAYPGGWCFTLGLLAVCLDSYKNRGLHIHSPAKEGMSALFLTFASGKSVCVCVGVSHTHKCTHESTYYTDAYKHRVNDVSSASSLDFLSYHLVSSFFVTLSCVLEVSVCTPVLCVGGETGSHTPDSRKSI